MTETQSELKAKILQAGRVVGKEVKRRGLTLHGIQHRPENDLTKKVAKQLTLEGIPLDAAKKADDIGAEMFGATVRATATRNSRMHDKGGPRGSSIKKVKPMVKQPSLL